MAGAAVLVFLVVIVVVVVPTTSFLIDGDDDVANLRHATPVKVAAFNIQHFGVNKMADTLVADKIVDILNRYDIVLVQETRDATGTALNDLWTRLNKTDHWNMVASDRVGRNSYKEQYVFYYRIEKAKYLDSFLLADSQDFYERDPFAIEFEYYSTNDSINRRVVLLALHSKPLDAYKELIQLPNDIVFCAGHFHKAGGVVALGDFNAGCRYVSRTRQNKLPIFNNASFTNLIPHSADTTSGSSDCAYDRIVVYGNDIIARDGQVFNYQNEYGLSDNLTLDISDHFPVSFNLY